VNTTAPSQSAVTAWQGPAPTQRARRLGARGGPGSRPGVLEQRARARCRPSSNAGTPRSTERRWAAFGAAGRLPRSSSASEAAIVPSTGTVPRPRTAAGAGTGVSDADRQW